MLETARGFVSRACGERRACSNCGACSRRRACGEHGACSRHGACSHRRECSDHGARSNHRASSKAGLCLLQRHPCCSCLVAAIRARLFSLGLRGNTFFCALFFYFLIFLSALPNHARRLQRVQPPVSNGAASLRTSPLGVEEQVLLSFARLEPLAFCRVRITETPLVLGAQGPWPSPEHLALLLFGVCDFLPVSGFRYFGDSAMTFSEGLSEEGWRTNPVALCSPSARASSARGRGSVPVSSHRRLPARWKHIKVFGFTLASLAY